MLLIVSLFWNICLTREGPERVPTHPLLIGLAIIGKIVLVLLINAIRGVESSVLEISILVSSWAVMIAFLVSLPLLLRQRLPRFPRVYGAILGSDLLMHYLYGLITVALFMLDIELSGDAMNTINVLFQLWIIFILGFIMHRALDLNIGLGIAIAFFVSPFSIILSNEVAKLL